MRRNYRGFKRGCKLRVKNEIGKYLYEAVDTAQWKYLEVIIKSHVTLTVLSHTYGALLPSVKHINSHIKNVRMSEKRSGEISVTNLIKRKM